MTKPVFLTLLLVSVISFNSKLASQSISESKIELIQNNVDAVFKEMIGLAEKIDYDGLSKGVDDKYNAGFISNGDYYTEYSELIKVLKPAAKGISSQAISLKDKKITVLADNLVLLTATGKALIIPDNGNSFEIKFQWSFVYEKIDGVWKVVHSHQSTKK